MEQHQHSITNKPVDNDSVLERPRIALLHEKHWIYVQKRYRMSPRESQVAKLVCQGFNNDEIAKALKIRPGTVKTHIRNIYRRIRVKNKIEMLLKFVNDITKFSTKSAITPPISIIDIEKPVKKPSASAEIRKKEK